VVESWLSCRKVRWP